MQISHCGVILGSLVVLCLSWCSAEPLPGGPENMARPTRPKVFNTPEELRSYLDQLGNFYAIQGRPRFGKRNLLLAPLAGYLRDRELPEMYHRAPISRTDILQMLSSANQGDD